MFRPDFWLSRCNIVRLVEHLHKTVSTIESILSTSRKEVTMTVLTWDGTGERFYETGVDRGVLYIPTNGIYDRGYVWNGLTAVTESPSGAEATALYADNIKYLNLVSAEEFGATIEAYFYPDAFALVDGTARPSPGVSIGQQNRQVFGFSYRTKLGNDTNGQDYGYKIHLIYGALAAPSERSYATVNDSPEAITFSWEVTTTPVAVPGLKPTAVITIDSTKVNSANLQALEDALYGTAGTDARLPLPEEVIAIFAGGQTIVTPAAPNFNATTGVITIPSIVGITYRRADNNQVVSGTVTIPASGQSLVIRATPASGSYKFAPNVDDDWSFTRS
jgi:hypothetical protein